MCYFSCHQRFHIQASTLLCIIYQSARPDDFLQGYCLQRRLFFCCLSSSTGGFLRRRDKWGNLIRDRLLKCGLRVWWNQSVWARIGLWIKIYVFYFAPICNNTSKLWKFNLPLLISFPFYDISALPPSTSSNSLANPSESTYLIKA